MRLVVPTHSARLARELLSDAVYTGALNRAPSRALLGDAAVRVRSLPQLEVLAFDSLKGAVDYRKEGVFDAAETAREIVLPQQICGDAVSVAVALRDALRRLNPPLRVIPSVAVPQGATAESLTRALAEFSRRRRFFYKRADDGPIALNVRALPGDRRPALIREACCIARLWLVGCSVELLEDLYDNRALESGAIEVVELAGWVSYGRASPRVLTCDRQHERCVSCIAGASRYLARARRVVGDAFAQQAGAWV